MAELREAMRRAGRQIGSEADSLVRAQTELARQLEDLAAERERGAQAEAPGARGEDQLPFSSVERAQELLRGERDVVERARALQEQMRDLADAAWQAGLTDPEFQRQLRDIQDLLERALDEELEARLDALREALQRLDAEGTRDALRELARQAAELREELTRGRELFERAAVEGDLTSLARDAEELAAEQRQWNERAEQGVDSAAAEREAELARRVDSLAAELERLEATIDSVAPEQPLEGTARRAEQAARRMQQAAGQAGRGDAQGARESGEAASEALDPISEALKLEREELREAWREEVMAQLDRALVETAQLAREQEDLTRRLALGEAGTDVRGAQAANRDGVDRVIERLQGAASKNALVSARLGAALGLAKLKMSEALDQVQRANPNTREGERLSGEAQDALTAVIYALLQTQGQVSGSQSGSGLQEAMEQLAELAEQQGELSGQSSGMLSQVPAGGDRLMEELRALAQRQRALAQELERMGAEGEVSGTDELADEADELADRLESGRLDRDLVERQEQLFRRLLDAGRSLESDEEDETRERVSQAADPALVRLPGAAEAHVIQQRYPYPTWEQLRRLTPEERRLILDYFQRLNDARR
jgi:hypothetical protein